MYIPWRLSITVCEKIQEELVKPKGVILVNSTLISIEAGREDVDELRVPVNDIAVRLGNVRSANIVALSAFVARARIVKMETLRRCVKEEFASKEKLIPLNMAAVEEGEGALEEEGPAENGNTLHCILMLTCVKHYSVGTSSIS